MAEKFYYGDKVAEVEDASGVSGVIIRDIDGEYLFRVYHPDHSFTDYEIFHDDLPVIIEEKSLSSFYSVEGKTILDHSPQVLGLKRDT